LVATVESPNDGAAIVRAVNGGSAPEAELRAKLLAMERFRPILAERDRQDARWGPARSLPKDRTPEHWLAILLEEVGELSEAVVEEAAIHDGSWRRAIQDELIHTAAVAVSWLEWIAAQEE
jgi:NTP pyrophosphatase (non-canonical NTP hydrolase)